MFHHQLRSKEWWKTPQGLAGISCCIWSLRSQVSYRLVGGTLTVSESCANYVHINISLVPYLASEGNCKFLYIDRLLHGHVTHFFPFSQLWNFESPCNYPHGMPTGCTIRRLPLQTFRICTSSLLMVWRLLISKLICIEPFQVAALHFFWIHQPVEYLL